MNEGDRLDGVARHGQTLPPAPRKEKTFRSPLEVFVHVGNACDRPPVVVESARFSLILYMDAWPAVAAFSESPMLRDTLAVLPAGHCHLAFLNPGTATTDRGARPTA